MMASGQKGTMKTLEEALAAIEEMKTAHDEEKERLKTKNKELVDREKSAKTLADEAADRAAEAERLAAEKSGDTTKLTESLNKKHAAELKKLTDANTAYETRLASLLIDNTINEAIAKNGVLPQYAPAVTALLKSGAKMENGEAFTNGVPLAEHVTSFFTGDEGRYFVAAPANSGGGAQGSTAKPATAITSVSEFMKLAKENPAAAASANLDPSIAYLKSTLS